MLSFLGNEQACVGEEVLALGCNAELVNLDVDGVLHLGERGPGLERLGHREVGVKLGVAFATFLGDAVHLGLQLGLLLQLLFLSVGESLLFDNLKHGFFRLLA